MIDIANDTQIGPGPVTSQTQAAGKPSTRVLLGFFQPADALPYVQSIGADVDPADVATQHAAAMRQAAQLGSRLETTVIPIADSPHILDLRGEPTFAEHGVNAKSVEFAYVEVAKLVACQPRIDWDHVQRLAAQVPKSGDDDALLRFCLPLQRDGMAPQVQANFNPVTNTFGCIVDNPDVRICGPVQGGQPGTGRGLVGFSIGPGLHQMSVVSFNGRYMLNNGYHRAVALLRAGHDRIPVILVETTALELTPTARNGMFSPQIVFGPKAARIADFMTPAAVDFTSRRMRLLFSVHAEVHAIPG